MLTARQIAVQFAGQGAPCKMRIGRIRFDIEISGMVATGPTVVAAPAGYTYLATEDGDLLSTEDGAILIEG